MSTYPLTLVAGEIRMPRLRPLELVSRSLGREWSLLPPNVSFRTELKALYAAMLRTFCLNADAIRAMCRWNPQSLRAQPSASGVPDAAVMPGSIPLGMRHPEQRAARNNPPWNTLAAGACAIGGLATIAWLMAQHPRQDAPPMPAAAPEVTLNAHASGPTQTAQVDASHSRAGRVARPAADAPLEWNRARGDLTASGPGQTTASNALRADAERASPAHTQPASKADTPSFASRSNHDAITIIAPPRAHPQRNTRKANSSVHERNAPASVATRRVPHSTVTLAGIVPSHGVHASPETRQESANSIDGRARHLPSVAGAYSPPAPSARFDGEYDSVTMSASTHVRDTAPAASRQTGVNADNTDWMNHMSQRRVTEIPDRFSK